MYICGLGSARKQARSRRDQNYEFETFFMQPIIQIRYRFARFLRTSLSFPAKEAEDANGLPTERRARNSPQHPLPFLSNRKVSETRLTNVCNETLSSEKNPWLKKILLPRSYTRGKELAGTDPLEHIPISLPKSITEHTNHVYFL
jgi:hypothetical protein